MDNELVTGWERLPVPISAAGGRSRDDTTRTHPLRPCRCNHEIRLDDGASTLHIRIPPTATDDSARKERERGWEVLALD